jgi:hypothetical protein
MAAVVPTLDSRGYLAGIGEKATELLTNFLTSNYSQTELFPGAVKSLTYFIQRHMGDFNTMSASIEDALNQLYSGHFDEVSVSVSIGEPQADLGMSPVRYNIQINVLVTQDGVQESLGKLITISNSRIERIKTFERR